MFFIGFVLILFAAIFIILGVFGVESPRETENKKCQKMVERIQCDSINPTLTEMIGYHKENAEKAVQYRL